MARDFKQSSTGKYLVKPHDPWKQWAKRMAALALLAAIAWTAFELGMARGGYNRGATASEIDGLNEQVAMLSKRIEELMQENAQLISDRAIDSTASKQVNERLRELSEESLELKEELVFYRSLLSPADLEPGLQILGVKFIKGAHQNSWGYKIVLTQRRNRNQHADGHVEIALNGKRDGKDIQLQTTDVLEVGKSELEFRFKNFQSLEGQLRLPDNFEPDEVVINVIPKSRSLDKIERAYEWNSIISGG